MLNTLRAVEEPRPNIMRSPGSGLSFQGMDPGMVNQSLPKSEYRRGMSQDEGSILIQFADNLLPFLFQSVWDWDRASLCQQPDALHWPQVKAGLSHQTLPRFAQGIFIQGLQCVTYSMVGHRSCHDFGEF